LEAPPTLKPAKGVSRNAVSGFEYSCLFNPHAAIRTRSELQLPISAVVYIVGDG
jgi:hypothetical protein